MGLVVLERENNLLFKRKSRKIQDLITSFFAEFLEGFFPDIARSVNFDYVTFLPHHEHLVDHSNLVVAQTEINGRKTIIFVCLEREDKPSETVDQQMYQIFSMLHDTYQMPIIPILMFQNGTVRNQSYTISLPEFDVLTFRYLTVQVHKHKWPEYVKHNNVVAAVLLCELDFSEGERFQLHAEILKMTIRMHQIENEERLLYDYFSE